ncbi:Broad specificity phosphatase PhoE [Gracilibacillus ureilyticus]|uniref:Broad specificity phosphatase PhoE n=1 Tax=Gracilibacillus ureilyticus TaxID=531814 RepID=A0A1H9RSQ5_9BACI|nr:histidine phosphatase family protein [Gracilibacillus ureilyticus]SER75736.1 Broad specificity phosphatase PhoE [Gracilibacillus ureilyticus]
MHRLILIKHSVPTIQADIPSNKWVLNNEGKDRAKVLAEKLSIYHFSKVYTSPEPKAVETAEIVAAFHKKPLEKLTNTHEHLRLTNRKIYPEAEWMDLMKHFFEEKDTLLFGEETASEARARFDQAVRKLIKQHSYEEDILLVAHGTVISLFISMYNKRIGRV